MPNMAVLLAPIAAAAVWGVSAVGRERHRLPDTISEPLHNLAQGGGGREGGGRDREGAEGGKGGEEGARRQGRAPAVQSED